MFRTLGSLLEGIVIYGGDSNITFDQSLDKSKPQSSQLIHPRKISSKITKLIHQQGLADIWWEFNPTKRDYTHYSNPHQSYSRIDHIFIQTTHIPLVNKAYIKDTTLSDHSMMILILQGHFVKPPLLQWRLNETLLNYPITVIELENAMKEYVHFNNMDGISAETLWAAHKATIRGKIIQIATKLKKERASDVEKLERDFAALRKHHKKDPSTVQIAQLDKARLVLNLALIVKAENSIRWTGARFYQQKDKNTK